jgi:putative ABC transport system ATP-binding protein
MADLISIQGLTHAYAERPVLEIGAWSLAAGEEAAIAGPSGSGKSTLLHILAGLQIADGGTITVAGADWRALSPNQRDKARGRNIGIVFQALHLIGAISVRDNLRLAQRLAGGTGDDTKISDLLGELGIGSSSDSRPFHLSHGERQRVAIARAVINRPALILADEPTSALDDDNAATVMELLRGQARACGASLVVASHDRRILDSFGSVMTLGGAS